MAKVLDMPKLSPTMEEGQISGWHKKEGDTVDVDDLLAEVDTDKATMEFRSFDRGTLLKILAPAGSVVQLGQPVAILGSPGEDISTLAGGAAKGGAKPEAKAEAKTESAPAKAESNPQADKPEAKAEAKPQADKPEAKSQAENAKTEKAPDAKAEKAEPASADKPAAEPAPPSDANGRVRASPYVRKLARERGIDLRGQSGSGPAGRIVARDLQEIESAAKTPQKSEGRAPAADRAPTARPTGPRGEPELRPLSMMRKTIARRLVESKQNVPHFYLTIDVDAGALHELREQLNADLADGHSLHGQSADGGGKAPKLSYNDLLIKACAIALVRVPECNVEFTPDALKVHRRVDISVAVAVPDGLVTPVVRDADQKSVLDIASEVRSLAGRARDKKLKPDEMMNGTFSISNLGMYGIDEFSAVINPPEGAILAVGQVREEPVVRGGQLDAGQRLKMTLSCDHRAIDGAVGATFLRVLRNLCEHPSQILVL